MSAQRVIHVVPHTHWDREWYLPYQSLRMRLVDVVDRVLELMEAEPRFAFTLDGQLATLDDYLEIRPEAERRIRSRIAQGRLAVGPWQILMDEFLVSGETIVRNLERGRLRGEELGGSMAVGYLPDMFGHVAQMPQMLRRAGISNAIVWRGVPAAINRHAFAWEAPDGSVVRAEYLPGGYGNAAHLFEGPGRIPARIESWWEELQPLFGDDEVLALVGDDHTAPDPLLVELLEQANEAQDRFQLRIGTLGGYIQGSDERTQLPVWRGELRSGSRANMLMGVTSARIDLKAACSRVERLLERYAEPFQALYATAWPEAFLRAAWGRAIENSAHDSICGCSVDAVCAQVLVRYAEAEQIAGDLSRRAAEAVAAGAPLGSTVVLNPSPRPRRGLVELDLPIPAEWEEVALELPEGTRLAGQEVGRAPSVLYQTTVCGSLVTETMFRRIHGRELFGHWLNRILVDESDGLPRITFMVGREADPRQLDVEELKRDVGRAVGEAPDTSWLVRIVAAPRRRLLASVPAPPLGWVAVRPVRGPGAVEEPVEAEPHRLRNALLEVVVAADGTLSLTREGATLDGVGRLADGGDFGDSYNYAPPATDALIEEPESVTVELLGSGPVRGEMAVVRSYRWPLGVKPDGSARSSETALVPVTTHVELRAGEPFVRIRVAFENPCSDHRLRFHVPLAEPAESSFAEGQFAVVERGLEAEGGHGEVPLATAPASGFVDAGGVAALLDHVLEYELLDGQELALTLLRSTGLISRSANPYREEPAGPELAIPAAQCRGPWSVSLGLYPHGGSWVEAEVLAQMERYRYPFLTTSGTSAGPAESTGTGLGVDGSGVVLSSLRRRGDWLELRLICQQPEPRTAVVRGGFREARHVDLLGRRGEPLAIRAGALELELSPWEIRTVQLRR